MWSRAEFPPTASRDCDAIILAVPAQSCARRADAYHAAADSSASLVIISAKGIEQSDRPVHERSGRGDRSPARAPMVLSGPSFAADVMKGLPTAVTLAAPTLADARRMGRGAVASRISASMHSDDVLGVEIGGALKNVLAIACGISDGRGLGDSARAALTTRGFAELMRFGRKLGARPETLTGLSGLGDLLLTCSSRQSRNYSFGLAIGEGRSVAEALAASRGVVEGASYGQDCP